MPWEDEHFFSVEEYDEVTGSWFGREIVGTRGEVDDAILSIRRSCSRDGDFPRIRVVETRTDYI